MSCTHQWWRCVEVRNNADGSPPLLGHYADDLLPSNWKWPDIEGLHSFKGKLVHSANYDTTIDLNAKRVAVIGIGSSGIQITSNIASKVKQLYTWVKSPTWITAGFAQKFAGPNGGNFHCMSQFYRPALWP